MAISEMDALHSQNGPLRFAVEAILDVVPKPFLLFQLSDPHIGATWADADPVAGLEAVVEAARRFPDRPDAVLMTGDLADHAADEEYAIVRELLARLEAPLYTLPGNHDDRDALRRHFDIDGAPGTPVQYAADLGQLRLVVVDSQRPGEGRGELDAERLTWLDTELSAEPHRPTLVAMHHPPITTGIDVWDRVGLPSDDRRALGGVLRRHPQVRRVVAGHVHRTLSGDLAGKAVLAIPSTYVQARLHFDAERIELVAEPRGFAVHALLDGDLASHVQPVVSAKS